MQPDERKIYSVTAKIMGYAEKLYVNYTGQRVKKGDPLARIYSPKFMAAAEEYIQAIAQGKTAGAAAKVPEDAQRANRMADYARQRLTLAGFTNDQLDAIAKSGKPSGIEPRQSGLHLFGRHAKRYRVCAIQGSAPAVQGGIPFLAHLRQDTADGLDGRSTFSE